MEGEREGRGVCERLQEIHVRVYMYIYKYMYVTRIAIYNYSQVNTSK